MNEVVKILINRDGLTKEEAITEVNDMRARAYSGEDPEEILYEIGLEPDYIWDIL